MATPRNIDARRFYRVAFKRLEEAGLIFDKLQLYAASQYLAGYAVECIFKSLILSRPNAVERIQASEERVAWLKDEFRHNLNKLRKEAAHRGLVLRGDFQRVVICVNLGSAIEI